MRIQKLLAFSLIGFLCLFSNSVFAADLLPSWQNGPNKEAILAFVERVSATGSPDYVAPAERIAAFDNDGTLWAEQPLYFQLFFAIDRVRELAPQHPEWQTTEPFASLLKGDVKAALAGGEKGLLEIVMATHSGNTSEEFAKIVSQWIASARHPQSKKLFSEMTYQPMHELLALLKSKSFKTYIVSGGGIEFMRPWAEAVYGIPPEQVIGSSIKTAFEIRAGKAELVRLPAIDFIDDKEGKPLAINKFIGRRPIAAFGNSDGDLQMLQYTCLASSRNLCMLIHHNDAEREWAYDKDSHIGRLDKALQEAKINKWSVVDMKRDWQVIYPFSTR